MLIKDCIKKKGWQTEVTGSLKRCQTVDVDFVNTEGKEDETQFTITGAGTNKGIEELSKLFSEFCKENGLKNNTVISVTIIHVADTIEELES